MCSRRKLLKTTYSKNIASTIGAISPCGRVLSGSGTGFLHAAGAVTVALAPLFSMWLKYTYI